MKNYIYLLIMLSFISCKKGKNNISITVNSNETEVLDENNIKHAKGFKIKQFKGFKELIIKSPYPNTEKELLYILVEDKSILAYSTFVQGTKFVNIPVKKIVVTSTTHIPMLELLNEENSLVGFPNTKYISSVKTRELIKSNKIKELGKEENINTEILIDLKPDAVIGFSLNSNNKMFENIEKSGIPVVLNGDWLEKTPLGRAEWIKFFGVLYGKEKLADSIFNTIEKQYNEAKIIAKKSVSRPKIMSGVLYKDKWNLPAGESYVAQFLKDANVDYPWQNSKGSGSLSLSFESVFEKVKDAKIWIAPGHFESFKQLKDANQHYTQFNAFKNKQVYNFTKRKGETGGVLYYELAPMQPHIVLKDLIKVTHPELLDGYQPFYLDAIED